MMNFVNFGVVFLLNCNEILFFLCLRVVSFNFCLVLIILGVLWMGLVDSVVKISLNWVFVFEVWNFVLFNICVIMLGLVCVSFLVSFVYFGWFVFGVGLIVFIRLWGSEWLSVISFDSWVFFKLSVDIIMWWLYFFVLSVSVNSVCLI